MKSSVTDDEILDEGVDDILDEGVEEHMSDAYRELMGDDDEVDVFFILPRPPEGHEEELDDDDEDSLLVLRVTGLPEDAHAWVH